MLMTKIVTKTSLFRILQLFVFSHPTWKCKKNSPAILSAGELDELGTSLPHDHCNTEDEETIDCMESW